MAMSGWSFTVGVPLVIGLVISGCSHPGALREDPRQATAVTGSITDVEWAASTVLRFYDPEYVPKDVPLVVNETSARFFEGLPGAKIRWAYVAVELDRKRSAAQRACWRAAIRR
jgi:hypothetical protein